MAKNVSVQDAWNTYQEALNGLYARPARGDERPITRGGSKIAAAGLDQRSEAIVNTSQQLGNALAAALDTDNLDERELASWKLLAAAAYDLSVAGDLLEAERSDDEGAPTRSARSSLVGASDLREVLDAPMDTSIAKLVQQPSRAALSTDPTAARAQLESKILAFLEDIPNAAAAISQQAATGVISAGLAPAQQLATALGQEFVKMAPEGASIFVRSAARILDQAVKKLLANFSKNVQDQAASQANSWLKDIQENRDSVTNLLDKLYETPRIGTDVRALVTGAPADLPAERFNQATKTLEELSARYEKSQKLLEQLMRVLSFVKVPLLAAVPWGPLGVYATYVSVLGYAVISGGDYLDADRLSQWAWLDRVDGLQATVRIAVQTEGH
jgi:hypothetical protein